MSKPNHVKYTDTPFEPCLNYKMDFDPDKKAQQHTVSVEYD